MKQRLLSLLLMLTAMLTVTAQEQTPTTLEGWASRLQKFGKNIPQEQVFIHMDNTCYFLGDTLFFKAYTRRSDSGTPSKLSGLLYVELLNQDGYLVERQLIEMKNGQGDGSFCLLDTLYGGYYELRAYTRWQLNWGEYEHPHTKTSEKWFFNKRMAREYYRDYEKLYSRVFPVYDKPKTEGDYQHDMTVRPLRRHFKADNSAPDTELRLYPEGGHLVAGKLCRVAFEADDEDGMHLDGTLTVVDGSGNKVAEAKTEKRGRGSVEFTPAAGAKYTAQFQWEKGSGKEKMPDVEADGCAMMVNQKDGQVEIRMAVAGTAAQEELGMTVLSQDLLQDFVELGKNSEKTVTLKASDLRSGVTQVTVFNAQGRIYADRLFFVLNAGDEPTNLTFSDIKREAYEPFAPIKMKVQGGKAGSTISLSVRDAAHTEYLYDNGNIYTEMLLSSQIRGFVEDPAYYFEKNDEEHRRALDLLLMIQGWRRYNWQTMATPGIFKLSHMPEQTQLLIGEVNTYMELDKQDGIRDAGLAMTAEVMGDNTSSTSSENTDNATPMGTEGAATTHDGVADLQAQRSEFEQNERSGTQQTAMDIDNQNLYGKSNLKREVLLHAEFTQPGSEQAISGEMPTENGHFQITSPRFYQGCFFFLTASDTTKWKNQTAETYRWIESSEDERENINYPDFYVKLTPFYPRFTKPYNFYQTALAEAPKGSALSEDWLHDGSRTLQQVTVGARRNGMSRFDASKPAYVIDAYKAFNDVADAGLNTGVYYGAKSFARNVAQTYIGDMNIERNYELEIRYNSRPSSLNMGPKEIEQYNLLSNLENVYIYTDFAPRREGDKRYEASNQPIVTIDLRRPEDQGKRITYRDRRYVLQGYNVSEEFYQPDYSKHRLPDQKDYRRTLYWEPYLKLDANGQASVEFYNNGKQTQLSVSAEGMASDGTLMTGKSMPEER